MIVQDGKIRGLDSAFIRNKILEYEPDCLILTDSGTNSAPYEQMLLDCHIPLTVIDHHDATEDVCKHSIVVNNRLNNFECNTELSGCGVTFKVVQALDKEFGTKYSNRFIDLVGLSIISDSMDVRTYENRWFLKYILDDKEHIGVMAQELAENPVTSATVEPNENGILEVDAEKLCLTLAAVVSELCKKVGELEFEIKMIKGGE